MVVHLLLLKCSMYDHIDVSSLTYLHKIIFLDRHKTFHFANFFINEAKAKYENIYFTLFLFVKNSNNLLQSIF